MIENIPTFPLVPQLQVEDAQRQGRLLKALADPTRLLILSLLGERGGTLTVNQIVACFDLEQATISGHLHTLYHIGLIDFRKHQRSVYYFLNESALRLTIAKLEEILPATQREG